MGKEIYKKLIIISVCLLCASALAYGLPSAKFRPKTAKLNDVLQKVGNWNAGIHVSIDPEIVTALNLDDYLNRSYFRDSETVSLYIGYYLSKKKVGAAHDPMVCFPGQGFVMSDVSKRNHTLAVSGKTIDYAIMTAERDQKKSLIIYWFQSFDRTNTDTFRQKVNLYIQLMKHRREDNAFVRVTVPMGSRTLDECLKIGLEFVDALYPQFLAYVEM